MAARRANRGKASLFGDDERPTLVALPEPTGEASSLHDLFGGGSDEAAAGALTDKAPVFATYEGGGVETVLVHVGAVRLPEPKTLAEARGQVIAAYQDHLEAEWIEALRAGTTVEVNRALLQTLAD